jgi:hypothetical protein
MQILQRSISGRMDHNRIECFNLGAMPRDN